MTINMKPLFDIHNIRCSYDKNYHEGVSKVVLEIEHLRIPSDKKVFIVGESGIGKSTILEVLGLMNNTLLYGDNSSFLFYESDNQFVDVLDLWKRNKDEELSEVRRKHFSFIFQNTNLMRNFTAYENVAITRMLQGYSQDESFSKTSEVLANLGLEHLSKDCMAQELSGGQQQRLAFARAVLPDFTVLFGDEPTGNLDPDNATKAMALLSQKLDEAKGSSAIIVSHDMHLAMTFADIIIKIQKCERQRMPDSDEISYFGYISDDCIFVPKDSNREVWTNQKCHFAANEFENFLRKGK